MVTKMCINCKNVPAIHGRRYCTKCYLLRRKEFYYNNGGGSSKKYCGVGKCNNCDKPIKLYRKEQKYCKKCSVLISKIGNNCTSNYQKVKGEAIDEHRQIVEQYLNRKLTYNEVVHHCDGIPTNNSLDNLIVISRSQHGKLHQFIREQRASIEKSIGVKNENCWNTLIAQMTTTWLEMTNVKVIKLFEIGQPAAEPLKDLSQEEGSETMHVHPNV